MASSSGCEPGEVAPSSSAAAERDASVYQPEVSPGDRRFPRELRLTKRRQFQAVYQTGFRAGCPAFVVFGLPNGLGHSRIGLTVTKRVGGAVARNRIKRVMRDLFRRHHRRFAPCLDLVVNGRAAMLRRSYSTLEQDFLACCAELAQRAAR